MTNKQKSRLEEIKLNLRNVKAHMCGLPDNMTPALEKALADMEYQVNVLLRESE